MRVKSVEYNDKTNVLSVSNDSNLSVPIYHELPETKQINHFHIFGSYEIRQGNDTIYIESTNGKWSNVYYDKDFLTLAIVEER